MKVKAAVAKAHDAPLVIEGLELDEPRDTEILVRLIACGVSRADRDAIDGLLAMPLPFVPGGEGAGIVERVGEAVTVVAPGDAVIVTYVSCGHCANCSAGHTRACADFAALNLAGRRLDGSTPFLAEAGADPVNGFFFGQSSFATHLICDEGNVIKVPMGSPLELFACLGGDLLLGAGTISHAFRLREGDTLVIAGADAIGLVATMVAKALGAGTIIVADPDETRRTLALDCGASIAVQADNRLADVVKGLTGEGVRFAFDTTGEAEAIVGCRDSLAPGGTLALLQPPQGTLLDFEDQITDGRRLVLAADGHAAPPELIAMLVALHAEGKLPIDRIIGFFPFELVNDALEASASNAVVKPVLRFSLGSFGDLDRALTEGAADEAPADLPEPTEPEREPALPPLSV